MSLKDANILITGGRGKLGSTMAAVLRNAGANICITSTDLQRAQERAAELSAGGEGPPVIGLGLDAMEISSLEALRDELVSRWNGRINGLVTCAGGNHKPEFVEPGSDPFSADLEAQWTAVEKNLKTTMLTVGVFGSAMLKADWSSIVTIGSMAGINGLPGIPGYDVAKAGVHSYTSAIAQLVPQHTGNLKHRINCIAFGFDLGDQNRAMLVNEDGSWKPRGGAIASMHPEGGWGKASDCNGPVKMLLDPEDGAGVHGAVIVVDRGFQSMGLPRYGANALTVK